jgi:hypothetical protein
MIRRSRMIALLITLALGQSPCGTHAALIAAATERAALFDLRGATTLLAGDLSTCAETAVPYWYLHGVIAAREAYRFGGSPESLEPVKIAIAQLESHTAETRAAEIARIVLMAASAAAQSEREEMGLLLAHAIDLERQQRLAGLPGAPIVAAQEVAGDLWLQVHRFAEARDAFLTASQQGGPTRRVTLGLARTLFRLGDLTGSCEQYQTLVAAWPQAGGELPELTEARTFLRRPECRKRPESQPRR